jgi:phage I-like protein
MPRSSLSAHIAIAICSARSTEAIALAACAFAVAGQPNKEGQLLVQLTPAGDFKPDDGRDIPVAAWHIDEAVANQVIARFSAKRNPRVLDYEHQTLKKEENGQPAPAAGWITQLKWENGHGLFGLVQLNARAREAIEAGEYRYISPVFTYDRRTGDVLDIQMAALTNTPAIDGMQPLELRAAATFGIHQEENPMNKLLAAVIAGLALATTATEDDALAALTAHFKADPLAGVRKALGVADDAKSEAIVAACSAIKTKADTSTADPAKFVPIASFEAVKTELASLTAKFRDSEVTELVETGLKDGRLLPAQKEWATELGKKDVAALSAYLTTAQPIAALTKSQTGGTPPEKTEANPHALTESELAVCSATGISAEDFAKSKAATAQAA